MATNKCPRCDSPCIIKIVAESSEEWCEVDVCKMCGSMYPRKKAKSAQGKGVTAKKKAKKPSDARPKSTKKTVAKKKATKGRKTR